MPSLPIDLLIVLDMPQYSRDYLAERYTVHYWPDPADHPRLLSDPLAKKIRAVQTNGSYGLKRRYIEAMPALEIICAVGAGFEGIDVEAARGARASSSPTAPGANAASVAEQAWALLLATVRRVPVVRSRACATAAGTKRARSYRRSPARSSASSVSATSAGRWPSAALSGSTWKWAIAAARAGRTSTIAYFDRLQRSRPAWCDVLMIAAPAGRDASRGEPRCSARRWDRRAT